MIYFNYFINNFLIHIDELIWIIQLIWITSPQTSSIVSVVTISNKCANYSLKTWTRVAHGNDLGFDLHSVYQVAGHFVRGLEARLTLLTRVDHVIVAQQGHQYLATLVAQQEAVSSVWFHVRARRRCGSKVRLLLLGRPTKCHRATGRGLLGQLDLKVIWWGVGNILILEYAYIYHIHTCLYIFILCVYVLCRYW